MPRTVVEYDVVPFSKADLFNTPIVVIEETNDGYCYLLDATDVKGKIYSSTENVRSGIWAVHHSSVYAWAEKQEIGLDSDWWQEDANGDVHMMSQEKFSEFVKSEDADDAFTNVLTKPLGLLKLKKLSKSMLDADKLFYALENSDDEHNG